MRGPILHPTGHLLGLPRGLDGTPTTPASCAECGERPALRFGLFCTVCDPDTPPVAQVGLELGGGA